MENPISPGLLEGAQTSLQRTDGTKHNHLIQRNGIPPIIVAGVTCPNFGRMPVTSWRFVDQLDVGFPLEKSSGQAQQTLNPINEKMG